MLIFSEKQINQEVCNVVLLEFIGKTKHILTYIHVNSKQLSLANSLHHSAATAIYEPIMKIARHI